MNASRNRWPVHGLSVWQMTKPWLRPQYQAGTCLRKYSMSKHSKVAARLLICRREELAHNSTARLSWIAEAPDFYSRRTGKATRSTGHKLKFPAAFTNSAFSARSARGAIHKSASLLEHLGHSVVGVVLSLEMR